MMTLSAGQRVVTYFDGSPRYGRIVRFDPACAPSIIVCFEDDPGTEFAMADSELIAVAEPGTSKYDDRRVTPAAPPVVPPRTMRELKAALKTLGMVARFHADEYRIAFPGDEASAYYTPDIADAWGTAKHMYRLRLMGQS